MQIFELIEQKLKRELVNSKVKTELKKELMKKKLDARIATSAGLAATALTLAPATFQKRTMIKEDDIIGKIPVNIKNITLCFAGLPY